MTRRIDAHQHFWRYSPAEYAWINEDMRAIRRDFLPADLAPLLAQTGIDGTVAVQARQSLTETHWLLELASAHTWIRGVVGWVPLANEGASIRPQLDRLAAHPQFKGVRHVLQDEPDSYFEDPAFNAALREVAALGLTYDLLITARQLHVALRFVDRHPELRIVVDHLAKPRADGAPPPEWRAGIADLARRPNVFCKFSGLVTEVPGWSWTPALLRPYFEVVLSAFGPSRLMFGSDWPVCLVAASYADWVHFVGDCVTSLSPDERDAILGGSATTFYRLPN